MNDKTCEHCAGLIAPISALGTAVYRCAWDLHKTTMDSTCPRFEKRFNVSEEWKKEQEKKGGRSKKRKR